MGKNCSWCYNTFESIVFDEDKDVMCPDCSKWHKGTPDNDIHKLLEEIPVPVISLAADNTIITANTRALDVFNLAPIKNSWKKAGAHFNCENSHLPDGCGKTDKCMSCTIRKVILTTYLDGMPRENVSATINTVDNKKVGFIFSAVRVKGNVWIRFDKWMIHE